MQTIQASGSSLAQGLEKSENAKNKSSEAFAALERGVHAALETYSNVHRGSGHNSMVSTHLFEQARDIVLEYLGLKNGKYVAIFCTPGRAATLRAKLEPENYMSVSSQDIGLSLGVMALAVDRKALPRGTPFQTGGGTTRIVSPGWVVWTDAPDKFEAGTPAIINIIAFAWALRLTRHFGNDAFRGTTAKELTAFEILYNDELKEYSGPKLLNELRHTLIGRGIPVPTTEGLRPYINLDNAASTPAFIPVWDTVCQAWRQSGLVQQKIIQEVKSICAGVLGAPLTAYDVIFTSNTTEAINLTAESLSHESGQGIEPVVLNTLLEHTSNDLPWRMVPNSSLIRLKVDAEGFLDLNQLDTLLRDYNQEGQYGKKHIRLVAVSGASNVLGVFNNLEEISRTVHRYGALLLVDAAQLVAHRKIEMERCGIDYLIFSAHKVYAPFGTGVLVVRKGLLNFTPSEIDLIQSSGEENAAGIAALGKALLLLQRIGLDLIQKEEQVLTARVLRGLAQIEDLRIFGIKDPDSPRFSQKGGVIAFALKGIMANKVAKELAERGGIGVRYGCHCAHLLVKHLLNVPPFLEQLQRVIAVLFHGIVFPGLARVSLGIGNNYEDVDTFIHVLGKIARQRRTALKTDVKKQMDEFVKTAVQRVYTQL
jgi:selenocysteine lyase/cysteine desulfurase